MKLYSYIVKYDSGFAPNPFWGYCTLADCKPVIRRTANIGDWVVGLSPKADGNRIIYVMRIDEIIPYAQYYRDCRFRSKRPKYSRNNVVYKCGDNIYKPLSNNMFQQIQSMHSNGKRENPFTKIHDLGGRNVLISKKFYYFGAKALELPERFYELKVGRAHKSRFSSDLVAKFVNFIRVQKAGVNAPPTIWPMNDDSWKTAKK